MKKDKYIGIDLGGTKILTAVADKNGKIIAEAKLPTETELGQEKIKKNIFKSIESVMEKAELHNNDIRAIGIGSPGPLDVESGVIHECSNLPIKNMPIVDLIEEKTDIPASLQNDANTAALGEKVFGAGKEAENLLYITISTGVGGGIIIDGKIYYGVNGNAGELGHITIDPDGPLCGCGNQGCLESFSSGTAIRRMAVEALNKGESKMLAQLHENEGYLDAALVAQAASEGDEVSKEIFKNAGNYLGIGLANFVNIFNPEMIILGGGVMKAKEFFLNETKEVLKQRALEAPQNIVEIKEAVLGDHIGVKGAIAVAMQKTEG